MSRPTDLVQGTLDLLLLKILALEPLNGWAISQRLKQVSGDVLQVSDGSLYPALHKLEQEGWIALARRGGRHYFNFFIKNKGNKSFDRNKFKFYFI